jgi:hypothetical protein
MKDIKTIIAESVINGGRKTYVQEAVHQILGEDIKSGQNVAVIDDVISGYTGAKGKVKSISDSNPGFADVELENGTTVKMQTSLLVPV